MSRKPRPQTLKNILKEMTLKQLWNHIRSASSAYQLVRTLTHNRQENTETLTRHLSHYQTSFSMLKSMTLTQAQRKFGRKFNRKVVGNNRFFIYGQSLENKTLAEIHQVILKCHPQKTDDSRKTFYSRAANLLGVSYETLLRALANNETPYHELEKLSVEEAENKFPKKYYSKLTASKGNVTKKDILEAVRNSKNMTYAITAHLGLQRAHFPQVMRAVGLTKKELPPLQKNETSPIEISTQSKTRSQRMVEREERKNKNEAQTRLLTQKNPLNSKDVANLQTHRVNHKKRQHEESETIISVLPELPNPKEANIGKDLRIANSSSALRTPSSPSLQEEKLGEVLEERSSKVAALFRINNRLSIAKVTKSQRVNHKKPLGCNNATKNQQASSSMNLNATNLFSFFNSTTAPCVNFKTSPQPLQLSTIDENVVTYSDDNEDFRLQFVNDSLELLPTCMSPSQDSFLENTSSEEDSFDLDVTSFFA